MSPGQVLTIQGAGFGANPEVWIQVVTSSATPTPTTQLTNIVNKSDSVNQGSFVAAEIPTSVPMGLYAIFVKNAGVASGYKWVNQASVTQLLDTCGSEIDPNRTFRLMGKNLKFSGTSTTVQYKNTSTGALTPAVVPVQTADPYVLTVTSPTSLTSGTYELVVNNGYGGTGANGDISTGIVVTARAGGTDPFNLGVPWASDFSALYSNSYNVTNDSRLAVHATPNDGLDDGPGIQAAIDAAYAAGGGRVYLPAGTYDITSGTLFMTNKNKVVLQGAGKLLTKIYCNITTGSGYIVSGYGSPETLSYVGFADLGFECGPSGPPLVMRVGGNLGKKSFIARCEFYNHGATIATDQTLIEDSDMNGSIGTRHKDILIRRNTIQWASGRLNFYSDNTDTANPFTDRLQIDSNTFSRSVLRPPTGPQCGGLSVGGAQNVAILNNTFDRLEGHVDGSGNPIYPTYYNTKIPESNDGETIMNENYSDSHNGVGSVTSATSTTLSDTAATFGSGQLNWYVTIIQGPGVGQTRYITAASGNTLTVSPAWDVTPTSASNYAIDKLDDNYLVKNNTFKELNRAIWLCYSGTIGNVSIVSNNLVDTNGIYVLGYADPGWAPGRFNILKDILIENNTLSNVRKWYAAQVSITGDVITGNLSGTVNPPQIFGNHFYNVAVRNNSLTADSSIPVDGGGTGFGQGYNILSKDLAFADDDSAAIHGVLFDNNTAYNLPAAYALDSTCHSVTIWNSINNNVGQVVSDNTVPGSSHPSVSTAVAWSTTSNVTPPYVSVTVVNNATEGTLSPGTFRFTRNGTSGNLVVNYTTSTNSATQSDYSEVLSGSVTIPSGSTSKDVTITAVHDNVMEGAETLTLTLVGNANYKIGNPNATMTIIDADMTMVTDYIGTTPSGSFTAANSVFAVSAAGTTFGANTADNFRFAYNTLTGDGSITACVTGMSGGNGVWNQGGVMIRESLAVGARHVSSILRGGQPALYARRTTTDAAATSTSGTTVTFPYWVRVTRVGDTLSAFRSADGTNWGTAVGTATLSPSLNNVVYIGLAVSSTNSSVATVTYSNITTTGNIGSPSQIWTNGDIGTVGTPGSTTYDSATGTFTVKGSGASIASAGTADNFQFVSHELNGDGSLTARVVSLTGGNGTWAQAGVMFREGLTSGARHGSSILRASQPAQFIRRSTVNGTSSTTTGTTVTFPYWVRVTRVGAVLTAYRSPDNVNWTSVGSVTLSSPAAILNVGLAVSAAGGSSLATGIFDNVQ